LKNVEEKALFKGESGGLKVFIIPYSSLDYQLVLFNTGSEDIWIHTPHVDPISRYYLKLYVKMKESDKDIFVKFERYSPSVQDAYVAPDNFVRLRFRFFDYELEEIEYFKINLETFGIEIEQEPVTVVLNPLE